MLVQKLRIITIRLLSFHTREGISKWELNFRKNVPNHILAMIVGLNFFKIKFVSAEILSYHFVHAPFAHDLQRLSEHSPDLLCNYWKQTMFVEQPLDLPKAANNTHNSIHHILEEKNILIFYVLFWLAVCLSTESAKFVPKKNVGLSKKNLGGGVQLF